MINLDSKTTLTMLGQIETNLETKNLKLPFTWKTKQRSTTCNMADVELEIVREIIRD